MSVRDGRRAPFVWQSVPALELIRREWSLATPSRAIARSIYGALTEIANEDRARSQTGADSDGFEAARNLIAEKAGTSAASVERANNEFERLGLLRIERRRVGGQYLPSVYTLLEPEPTLFSAEGVASTGGESHREDATPASRGSEGSPPGEARSPLQDDVDTRKTGTTTPPTPPRGGTRQSPRKRRRRGQPEQPTEYRA